MTEEEAFTILLETHQIAGEKEAEVLFKYSDKLTQVRSQRRKRMVDEITVEAQQDYLSRNRSAAGFKRKMGHEWDKITDPVSLQRLGAKSAAGWDAGIHRLERSFYGLEANTSRMFEAGAVGDVLRGFTMGDLNVEGGAGEVSPAERARQATNKRIRMAENDTEEGRKEFMKFMTRLSIQIFLMKLREENIKIKI